MKLYIFDLDGTLYRGEEAIPHAVDVVAELRKRGSQIRYLTNNSGQTREFYRDKLRRLGFEAEENEIYSSATGTAAHLVSENWRSAYVVGQPGLVATLREGGIEVVNAEGDGRVVEKAQPAKAVVVGICREFTYRLLDGAMQQLLSGAHFVATNTDATFPLEAGRLSPGAGSIVAAVSKCSGKPPFIVGKPNPYLIQMILMDSGVEAAEALVVGDRLDTDIRSGQDAGCLTFLVLTGVETSTPEGQFSSEDLRGLL